MRFTSSWDDGYRDDLEIADLLNRRGLLGTFYVCPKAQNGMAKLTEQEIRSIAEDHEIGAHTMTHPWLTKIPLDLARQEIVESKQWVESTTGTPCTMFCYPYGAHSDAIRSIVREAGFSGARTTATMQFRNDDPLAMPVSLQVMSFPWRKRFHPFWKILDPLGPLRANCARILQLGIPLRQCKSWLSFATALFEYALKTEQPSFHLFGHSSEITHFGLLDELEKFLDIVKESGVESATNSGLISRLGVGG